MFWNRVRTRSDLQAGFLATLPVALGCAPFGIAYGAIAASTLHLWQTSLMSMTLFAGTAQFVAASMLAQGASFWPILLTCALVNLRLVLLSAAMAPKMQGASKGLRLLAAQALTDESFAVSMASFRAAERQPVFLVGSGLAIFLVWQMATVIGRIGGELVPEGIGLEYALPASLICLLFMLVRNRRQWLVVGMSAALVLVTRRLVQDAWVLPLATMAAATLGLGSKRWTKRC